MPRQVRYIIPKVAHHAMQRGNNRQQIFFNSKDKQFFCQNLKKYSKEYKAYIGAYCLMDNHLHLLVYPDSKEGMIKFMKSISQYHTQYINRQYKRSGKLWENRYKMHLVDPDYEWTVARYIELNPVRANMVNDPTGYQYSSARNHLKDDKDDKINKDIIKERKKDYRGFVEEGIKGKEIKQIRDVLQQGKILGTDEFIDKIEKKLKITLKVRGRGRPVKIK
ncbi:MAG: transposase [Candidatus Omnitrophica bacterium]|nr:transposase [Candidatus Omnitrophota bacterium]MCF7891768.1 transposase [Candidatus Omnitrophota bacterium]MCF7897231.1 transposase [Candidatus Omnitrophota bacterium]MCF7909419.1 transposase [Candidatus Omnitrophota bacterium]